VRVFSENRRWRNTMLRTMRFLHAVASGTATADLDERIAVLQDSHVFQVVGGNELRLLAAIFEPRHLESGDALCRIGDRATHVYVVAAGQIDVVLASGATARQLTRGGVVGEYGMFTGGTRTASLIARTAVDALELDYERFERFLLAFPESALALLRFVVGQLVASNDRLAQLGGL
jgi:CRP-like cAMP-binding protein